MRPAPAPGTSTTRRMNRAFGPIAAGVIIDLIDLATFGPIGLFVGLPVGALAGFWLGSCLGLSRRASVACALAAAVYCTIPFTEVLPLGTLAGAYARFMDSDRSVTRTGANEPTPGAD
ncbi:MAG: hypothetical protein AB7Q17_10905 [Phycisphaerae bacterium]